ncbi:MAG: hypothetical protein WKG01_03205 [Kofleriaceae bacterium]
MNQALALGTLLAIQSLMTSVATADKKPYTLADLKELVSQKSFKEAVEHLNDVAPSERKAEWLDTAATAGAGYIAGLSNDNMVTKVIAIEQLDADVAPILKVAKYTKVRAEIGLKAYDACLQNNHWADECVEHAIKFVETDASNVDLALRMAKIVRKNAKSWAALPFFKRALAGKPSAAACKDADLSLAVISGLALPKDYDRAADARTIAGGACWDHLKKPILAAFDEDSENGYVRQNSCDLLKAKKALGAEQARTCK